MTNMGLALQWGKAAAGVDQFLSNEDPVFMQTSSALKQKQIPPRECPRCQDTFLSEVLRLRVGLTGIRGELCAKCRLVYSHLNLGATPLACTVRSRLDR